jgi:DNA invertase Pin-like site-specific DNA recombinase
MQPVYNAAAYARASKDDADSATIKNQMKMICDYIKKIPAIRIVSHREDNGFSGVDFLRPAFNEMMTDIVSGKINCVVVKDFSRLGRNYIEVGELMEEIFPRLNVRLISINDHYDSVLPRTEADEIIIPFKHLIDEYYLRESSVKIRGSLRAKRRAGEFVAAFAAYGYKRAAKGNNSLVPDGHAADVVRRIFNMKMDGANHRRIAGYLNGIGEPSPAEYKQTRTGYKPPFQKGLKPAWSAVAVGRILRNPVYAGTLVQGKQTTPSYKIKKRVDKPKNEWDITRNAHEAVVSRHTFSVVSGLLARDSRTPPGKNTVYPLSGMVFCADCKNNMVRTKSQNYFYYVCASGRTHGQTKNCASRCIRQSKLESAVAEALKRQISPFFGGAIPAPEFTRRLTVCFIERVEVMKGRHIVIYFHFKDRGQANGEG